MMQVLFTPQHHMRLCHSQIPLQCVSPRQTRCHTGLRTPLSWMTVLYSECKKSERKCCSTFLWKNRAGLPKPSFLPERPYYNPLPPTIFIHPYSAFSLYIHVWRAQKKKAATIHAVAEICQKVSSCDIKSGIHINYGPIISCIWSQKGLFCSYLNRIVSFYIKTCFATLQKNKNKQFSASLDINSGCISMESCYQLFVYASSIHGKVQCIVLL